MEDLRPWRASGVTEQHVLAIQRLCTPQSMVRTHVNDACHVSDGFNTKAMRMLVEGGDVFLTHLAVGDAALGHPDYVGFLLELYETSRHYQLPNVEFAFWAQDEALPTQEVAFKRSRHRNTDPDIDGGRVRGLEGKLPLLVRSKRRSNVGLSIPWYSAYRCLGDFDGMVRNLDALVSPAHGATPWEERKPVAFGRYNRFCAKYVQELTFRNSTRRLPCVRDFLHGLSLQHQDVLDVGVFDEDGRAFVPIEGQTQYKYLVSTDGWAVSAKLERYMLQGSTVLKAHSDRLSWFYPALRPGAHYVPFMVDNETDILDAVAWLRQHDAEARAIAEAARRFVVRNLNREARMCYLFTLLSEFAKLFKYTPSCSRRNLCVPAIEDVRWHSLHFPQKCKYDEVLLTYGSADPFLTPEPDGSGFGLNLTEIHRNLTFIAWENGARVSMQGRAELDYKPLQRQRQRQEHGGGAGGGEEPGG